MATFVFANGGGTEVDFVAGFAFVSPRYSIGEDGGNGAIRSGSNVFTKGERCTGLFSSEGVGNVPEISAAATF
jgi:hypothetical protein